MLLRRLWYSVPCRLRSLFLRRKVEAELSEELQYHLEMKIEEFAAKGLGPEEARCAALRAMDGIELRKEECRDMRRVAYVEDLLRDVRYGLSALRRNPGFTAIAVLTLGLGIGATTAIFTVVNAVLLRPLPYPEPERLVYLHGDTWGPFSSAREFFAWRDRSQTLSHIAAYMDHEANFTGSGEPVRVNCGAVTASFFPLLGVQPASGRSFLPEEDRPGGPSSVILSHSFWKNRLGGDPAILGKRVNLDGTDHTVVGILPSTFQVSDQYRFNYDFWVPLALDAKVISLVRVVGRLKPGVSLELAHSELDTILQTTLRRGIKRHALLSLWHEEITGKVKPSLFLFLGAVGFVLLIACVNVANLFLARAAGREREMVVRRALGAGKLRIVRHLLTESVLMALLGGGLGLALAFWGKDLLVAFISITLPTLAPITLEYRVLGFNLGLALLTGLAFGFAPAWQASRISLNEALKEAGRNPAEGPRGNGLRNLLVVSEIALAMLLLVGAGLLLKSFLRLRGIDAGFKTDHILCMSLDLTSRYPKPRDQARFFQQVVEHVRGLTGVQSVAVCSHLSMEGGGSGSVTGAKIEGRQETYNANTATIGPDYFRILGIPLTSGCAFTDSDREGTRAVAIVDESFARRYFPNENCVGKRVESWGSGDDWMTIVGVVRDARGYGPVREAAPMIYRPYQQDSHANMELLVRTQGPPSSVADGVLNLVRRIDRDLPPYAVMTLDQRLAEYLAPQRINMWLLTTFAVLALALAGIGVYGVISYSVSQRRHELGVRAALGAQPHEVMQLIFKRGLLLLVIGLGIGSVASVALSRFIVSMLYGVSATDPMIFGGVALVLAFVAMLACYIPARRATRIDPMGALRCE